MVQINVLLNPAFYSLLGRSFPPSREVDRGQTSSFNSNCGVSENQWYSATPKKGKKKHS